MKDPIFKNQQVNQNKINGAFNISIQETAGSLIQPSFSIPILFLFFLLIITPGCKKDSVSTTSYQVVNLVADTAGYGAARIDTNLVNPWGIAIGPTGSFWISSNHKSLTTIYDRNGAQLLAPIDIPAPGQPDGGAPTGVIYNSTSSFGTSKFIYVGEDGIVSAWSSGTSAITVADRSAFNAVYKGVTIANDGSPNFIYAANFKGNNIDVFDNTFNFITTKPFDNLGSPAIPADFAPFNIQNIGGMLYVTYAKHKAPDNQDDERGVGNGYINVFTPAGVFVKRFASNGTLNSPWAIAKAPDGFGLGTGAILIGNFGDGRINVYDSSGTYQGQLKDASGNALGIDGLWALTFPQNNIPAGDQNQLFFTAGPHGEDHGIFGYIKIQ